jgi:hypothetical protein
VTTIKVEARTRDDLARIAADDLGGATLNVALTHLLTEYRKAKILASYARLEADPGAWQDYESEIGACDGVAGDGLGAEA